MRTLFITGLLVESIMNSGISISTLTERRKYYTLLNAPQHVAAEFPRYARRGAGGVLSRALLPL